MRRSGYVCGVGILVLSIVLLSSGCALCRKAKKSVTVEVTPPITYSLSALQPEDVPVPANFAHQPDKSTYYVDGEIRTGSIKYVATAFVLTADVLNFYDKYMPAYGWKKNIATSANGKKFRIYSKKAELCKIIVYKNRPNQVELTIELSYNK